MSELKRHMGLFHLTMYGAGLILDAGIYVLIGEAVISKMTNEKQIVKLFSMV